MKTPDRIALLFLCAVSLSTVSAASNAAVLRVKADAPGPAHDGISWNTAYTAIQPAVNAAASGDEVWVAKGTYTGAITMKTGIALYGGFAGAEAAREQRDWQQNETVLDGTTYNGTARVQISAVTFPVEATESTILDGFTVTKGNGTQTASGTTALIAGGGVFVQGGTPVVRNNRITGNQAKNLMDYLYPSAWGRGGGIYIKAGTPRIEANRIEGNDTSEFGGGICADAGAPLVLRNLIANNGAFWSARMNTGGASGGVHLASGGVLDGNVITGNGAPDTSGAYIRGGRCINNTFAHNLPSFPAVAAVSLSASGSVVANNIFAYDGSVYWYTSTVTNNCVFLTETTSVPVGNIVADPLFVDAANGNYHLRKDSPCRDAGDDANASVNPVDMDGESRIFGSHIDIGADECVLMAGRVIWVTPPSATRANVFVSPAPAVKVVDSAGQTMTAYNGLVTLAIQPGNGTEGAALTGHTATAVNGVATFPSLAVTRPGSGYVLVPTARTLYGEAFPADASAPFAVTAGAARLVFEVQPQGSFARVPFSPGPVVAAVDDTGVVVPEFTGPVTLSIKSGTGTAGAATTGTATVNALNGLATFSGVCIDRPGSGYVLIATNPLLGSAESAPLSLVSGGPIRVSPTGDDGKDGATWASAFRTVQKALDAAAAEGGGEVWVARGTYTENLTVKAPTALYGGFTGTETSRDQRDSTVNTAILDGGAKGRVLHLNGGAGAYTVDGFTIRNGLVDVGSVPEGSDRMGAGLYGGGNLTVTHNRFENNVVTHQMQPGPQGYGSAVYVSGGTAVIRDNVFRQNDASADVGVGVGGTVFSNGATLTVERNAFFDNLRGAVKWKAGNGTVRNNLIARCGSGSAIEAFGPGRITNNTIVGTEYSMGYGAVLIGDASAVLSNNVIAFNMDGISLNYNVTKPTLHDNCLFGNTEGDYLGFSYPEGQDPNILADPLFVDRAADNYRLQSGSPCIDAGDDSALTPGEFDLEGNPRKMGAHADIGAYEFIPPGAFTLLDVRRAMKIAAGLEAMSAADDPLGAIIEPSLVDLLDVLAILRKVTGLSPNP